jgi:hypothetical protein
VTDQSHVCILLLQSFLVRAAEERQHLKCCLILVYMRRIRQKQAQRDFEEMEKR